MAQGNDSKTPRELREYGRQWLVHHLVNSGKTRDQIIADLNTIGPDHEDRQHFVDQYLTHLRGQGETEEVLADTRQRLTLS